MSCASDGCTIVKLHAPFSRTSLFSLFYLSVPIMISSATHMSQSPLSLLSLSDAAASAHHIPVQQASVPPVAPIPIKQRRRSSFSQNRKRRPSDARDPILNHSEDRDKATSTRLQMSLSLSPHGVPQGLLSKSAPMDGSKEEASQSIPRKKGTIFRCESCSKVCLFVDLLRWLRDALGSLTWSV